MAERVNQQIADALTACQLKDVRVEVQGASLHVWALATPLQLFTLLERLDVSMSDVARWLHVPKSSVSMWRHGTRAFPPKHTQRLYEETLRTFKEADEHMRKAASLAPTEALTQALQTEFAALWQRWATEVLYGTETLKRQMSQVSTTLGILVAQEYYRPEELQQARDVTRALLLSLDRLPLVMRTEEHVGNSRG